MALSEEILGTKAVEKVGIGKIKATYNFPPYERTLKDVGHVGHVTNA
jgi:hypothetical protein